MLRMMNLLKKKSRRLNRTKRMKRNRKMKNKKRTNKFQMKRNSIKKRKKEINSRQVVAKGVMKVIEITLSNLECTTKKDKEGAMEEVIKETTEEDTEEITDHLEEEIPDSKDVTRKMISKRIKLSGLVEEQEEAVVNSIKEEVEVMKERT